MKVIRYAFLSLCTVSVLGLGACANTVNGAGRDIENAGHKVQNAVQPQ